MTTETIRPTPLVDALETLRTRLIDALHGFDEALAHAEPDVAPVLQRMRSVHAADVEALGLELARLNGDLSADGSWMTPVQQAVVKARAWLTGIDEGVLPAVARGERALIGLYEDAIAQAGAHPGIREMLTGQRGVLVAQLASIEANRA
jgi:hypothetical protein